MRGQEEGTKIRVSVKRNLAPRREDMNIYLRGDIAYHLPPSDHFIKIKLKNTELSIYYISVMGQVLCI